MGHYHTPEGVRRQADRQGRCDTRRPRARRMPSTRPCGTMSAGAHHPRTPMTPEEIHQPIEKLTADIRVLSYSSTKAAAEKILQLQQLRRELRTQLAALEP